MPRLCSSSSIPRTVVIPERLMSSTMPAVAHGGHGNSGTKLSEKNALRSLRFIALSKLARVYAEKLLYLLIVPA
jgi:hypothetical protein